MTAFLTLNGISVPAGFAAPLSEEEVGSRTRAIDGSLVVDRRTLKRAWGIELVLDVAATQLAFRDLLDGKHEVWNWDSSAYSSKGNPAAVTGTAAMSAAQFKYGAKSLSMGNTDQANLSWSFFDPSSMPWCVQWWQRDVTTWNHYSEASDGTKRKNGAAGASTFWTAPSPGVLRYTSTGAVFLDDIWVQRFLPPVAWEASVYAATRALGLSPSLRAEGSLIEANVAAGIMVVAEDVTLDTTFAYVGGVWQQVHNVKAKLREA